MTDRRPESDEIVAIAERVCTRAQIEVVELHEAGLGYRTIGRRLGLSPTSVRDRLDRATERIDAELHRLNGGTETEDTE